MCRAVSRSDSWVAADERVLAPVRRSAYGGRRQDRLGATPFREADDMRTTAPETGGARTVSATFKGRRRQGPVDRHRPAQGVPSR
jgi:hypothetical protein